jgi:hypothetical protein
MSAKLRPERAAATVEESEIEFSPVIIVEFTSPLYLRPDREAAIGVAAYYRAEQRGFAPGGEMDDWLAAEQDVLRKERPWPRRS